MDKKSKKEILTQWRILGLLQGLKEGGIIEWRCAKSFEKMANYFIENNNSIFATTNWVYVLFPIIRRSLTKNKGRITNVIEPKDLTNFLQDKTIKELLDFVKMKKGKKKMKFFVDCFERLKNGSGIRKRELAECIFNDFFAAFIKVENSVVNVKKYEFYII